MHADELELRDDQVRRLVDRDLGGEFARLPLRRLQASGSTNALFRLGDDLLVRLPRQPGGSAAIDNESRWLPYIAARLPVPVPEIVALGEPGFGYPERWSVVRWIDGQHPATPMPSAAHHLALDLANVVAALAAIDPPERARHDAALRWYRGGPLSAIDDDIQRHLVACRELPELELDIDACAQVWEAALALPARPGRDDGPRWLHGDLLAENLLVRDSRLAAVLDFGALSVGDPSADLVVAWEVLDAGARDRFRSALAVDDVTWQRGRAWALAIAVMTFPYYWHTMPQRCAARLVMARAVLADHAADRTRHPREPNPGVRARASG